jgi:AcrR family transcriptional regulator
MGRKVENARQEQILQTALSLFRKRGFDATPMSEIAGALGMSKAGVYHHFQAKHEIVRALVAPLFDGVESLISEVPRRRELLEGYLDTMWENRELVALLGTDFSLLNQPEVGRRAIELNERLLEAVAGPGADLATRVRAESALWILRAAVIRFPEADCDVVREVALKSALMLLDSASKATTDR